MALYLVGDLQGCFDEFQQLLKQIKFSDSDSLWLCGDLVARGPKSLETLRWVKQQPNVSTVLGNHDLHLLSVDEGIRPIKSKDLTRPILNAPDKEELLHWLRHQPLLLEHPEVPLVMTHAGIYPGWSVAKARHLAKEVEHQLASSDYHKLLSKMYKDEPKGWQDQLTGYDRWRFIINAFTRMRFCTPTGELDMAAKLSPEQAGADLIPWFEQHQQQQPLTHTIAFGHWAALMGKTHDDNYLALDTGCVWGNHLTAYCWEHQKVYTQAAIG